MTSPPRFRPHPLTRGDVKRSLAERLSPIADSVRQRVAVRLGVRAYRVFLVWTRYGLSPQSERGDGNERLVSRVELLPAPRVTDLTAVNYRSWSVGTVPEGSVRVDRVSAYAYTEDELRGLRIPALAGSAQPAPGFSQPGPDFPLENARPIDFFYEVVEDGRGDDPANRRRFRLLGDPWRDPGGAQWVIALQRADRDLGRDGQPQGSGFPVLP